MKPFAVLGRQRQHWYQRESSSSSSDDATSQDQWKGWLQWPQRSSLFTRHAEDELQLFFLQTLIAQKKAFAIKAFRAGKLSSAGLLLLETHAWPDISIFCFLWGFFCLILYNWIPILFPLGRLKFISGFWCVSRKDLFQHKLVLTVYCSTKQHGAFLASSRYKNTKYKCKNIDHFCSSFLYLCPL